MLRPLYLLAPPSLCSHTWSWINRFHEQRTLCHHTTARSLCSYFRGCIFITEDMYVRIPILSLHPDPKGLFGVLITHLMTPESEDRPDGHIFFGLKEGKIYKDQVSFKVCCYADEDELCLRMLPTHLEVKFFPSLCEDRDQCIGEVCNYIRQVIKTPILRSLHDLHYNKDKVLPITCFRCDHCSDLHQVKKGKNHCKMYCEQVRTNARLPNQARCWYNEGEYGNIVTLRLSL